MDVSKASSYYMYIEKKQNKGSQMGNIKKSLNTTNQFILDSCGNSSKLISIIHSALVPFLNSKALSYRCENNCDK